MKLVGLIFATQYRHTCTWEGGFGGYPPPNRFEVGGMDGTGKYGKFWVREWTLRESTGIPIPYRTVREISRTVATLVVGKTELNVL
jgi:hypothetical protein